jgi:hypothetical protein
MPQHDLHAPLEDLALGDVVSIAGTHSYSVRALATWPSPILDLVGFALLGELDLLLGIPASGRPVDLYLPTTRFREHPSAMNSASEGVVRYWAPHLPSHGGAMAELLYRLLLVDGQIEPLFVLYRGDEAVVFERNRGIPHEHIQSSRLQRGADEGPLTKYQASFTPMPAYAPATTLYEQLTTR